MWSGKIRGEKMRLFSSVVSCLAAPLRRCRIYKTHQTHQTHLPYAVDLFGPVDRRPVHVTRAIKKMHTVESSPLRLFGPWPIASSEVFATSELSFAFVNLKPIVPGHVLVSPKAVVPRFTALSSEQVADLWTLAHRVGSMLEAHYKVDSLTLSIQDGPGAGQSVPHVHIHVLPRVKGDFEPNDKVYDALDEGDVKRNLDEDRVARTADEMAAEAALYQPYFE